MSVVEADRETIEELFEAGLGTPVVHRCVTATPSTGLVTHIVLPPRTPGSTPFSDLRDAGWAVEAVNPLDLPSCSCEKYGTHVLVSWSENQQQRPVVTPIEAQEKD